MQWAWVVARVAVIISAKDFSTSNSLVRTSPFSWQCGQTIFGAGRPHSTINSASSLASASWRKNSFRSLGLISASIAERFKEVDTTEMIRKIRAPKAKIAKITATHWNVVRAKTDMATPFFHGSEARMWGLLSAKRKRDARKKAALLPAYFAG
jgi:hypothetical protein